MTAVVVGRRISGIRKTAGDAEVHIKYNQRCLTQLACGPGDVLLLIMGFLGEASLRQWVILRGRDRQRGGGSTQGS